MEIEAIQARLGVHAEEAPAKLAANRLRRREQMPETAKIWDDLTARFGKLPYFSFTENGYSVTHGRRS